MEAFNSSVTQIGNNTFNRIKNMAQSSSMFNRYALPSKSYATSLSNSNLSIATMTGSTQNLLDSNRMLSMQEDVHSHRISTEVMKHRLYESVLMSPRHRRMSHSTLNNGAEYNPFQRMVFSMPVTPAHSGNASPVSSPRSTSKRSRFRFGGFLSRQTTPRTTSPEREICESNEVAENSECRGLASIFQPVVPKVIRALPDDVEMEDDIRADADDAVETDISDQSTAFYLQRPPLGGNGFKRPLPVRDTRHVKHKGDMS